MAKYFKEIGLARYQMVSDFDWSAGEEYWDKTKLFWLEVRNYWKDTLEKLIRSNSKGK